MNSMKQFPLWLLVVVLLTVAGCLREVSPHGTESSSHSESDVEASSAPLETAASPAVGLGGASWQLVQIMSMDDTTDTPADPALYTLEFDNDGSVRVRVDCNRATGSWSSESAGQLRIVSLQPPRLSAPRVRCTKGT